VYPGSRFLEPQHAKLTAAAKGKSDWSAAAAEDQPIRLLFVSRVVAHKGHRHVVMFAGALQRALDREVSVTFLGRDDPATTLKSDLYALGESEGVEVLLKGEVSEEELVYAYRQADLFVCFSEHEGFGMPIFEAMRLGLPVMCLGRTALRDTELGGQQIAKGDVVTLWNTSANWDERVFTNPETFDGGRQPNRHVSFGFGPHFCVGAQLGRIELSALFEALRAAVTWAELTGPVGRFYSNFLSGISSLPVQLHR
jgi:cytochrome P450